MTSYPSTHHSPYLMGAPHPSHHHMQTLPPANYPTERHHVSQHADSQPQLGTPHIASTTSIPIKRLMIDEDTQPGAENPAKKIRTSGKEATPAVPASHDTGNTSLVTATAPVAPATQHHHLDRRPEDTNKTRKPDTPNTIAPAPERRSSTGNMDPPSDPASTTSTAEPRGVSLPVPLPKSMTSFTFQQPRPSTTRKHSGEISPKTNPQSIPPETPATQQTRAEQPPPATHASQAQQHPFYEPYTPGYADMFSQSPYYDGGFGFSGLSMGGGMGMGMGGMLPPHVSMTSEAAFSQRMIRTADPVRESEYQQPVEEENRVQPGQQQQPDGLMALAHAADVSAVADLQREKSQPPAGVADVPAGSAKNPAKQNTKEVEQPPESHQPEPDAGVEKAAGQAMVPSPAMPQHEGNAVQAHTPQHHTPQHHTPLQPHAQVQHRQVGPPMHHPPGPRPKGPCLICARLRQQGGQPLGMPHQPHGGQMLMPQGYAMPGHNYGPPPSMGMPPPPAPQMPSQEQIQPGHPQQMYPSHIRPQNSPMSMSSILGPQAPQEAGGYQHHYPPPMSHAQYQPSPDYPPHHLQDPQPQQHSMSPPPPPTPTPTPSKKPTSTIVTAASTRLGTSPDAQRKPSPNLYVDIAETCLEQFPYAEVARRHAVSRQRVVDVFTAVVQLPLLRCPTDKRRVGRLGVSRMKEYNKAKKELIAEREREREARGETVGGGVGGEGHGDKGKGKGKGVMGGVGRDDGQPGVYEVAQFMGPVEMSESLQGAIQGNGRGNW